MEYKRLTREECSRMVNSTKIEDVKALVNDMVCYTIEIAPANAEKAKNAAEKFADFLTQEWASRQATPKTGKDWVAAATKSGMKL